MATTIVDETLLSHAVSSAFWPPGATILVAVSGGPDSLCLLHAFWRLQSALGLAGIRAAHVDHGLRGEDSAADAAFVAEFCLARDIPSLSLHLDIAAEAAQHRLSIQDAARQARYAFLDSAADTLGASLIATAHTRDDQAETVLLNVLRGTGIAGLKGIPEKRGRIIRPLLGVPRSEIERYCVEYSLTPRQDASNTDPGHYLRNRVRLELLPLLDQTYHPGVRGSLLRLARLAAQDSDYLEEVSRREFERLRTQAGSGVRLPREALRSLPPAISSRLVRLAFGEVRGTDEGLAESHVEKALGLSASGITGSVTSPMPACIVLAKGEWLEFRGLGSVPEVTEAGISLPVPGMASSPRGLWTIAAGGVAAAPLAESISEEGTIRARVDADAIDIRSLYVRHWEAGDRIAPLGMGGRTKKLQDVFADAKIPRHRRRQWPIVCDSRGPIWIPDLVFAERAKVTMTTRSILPITAFLTQ